MVQRQFTYAKTSARHPKLLALYWPLLDTALTIYTFAWEHCKFFISTRNSSYSIIVFIGNRGRNENCHSLPSDCKFKMHRTSPTTEGRNKSPHEKKRQQHHEKNKRKSGYMQHSSAHDYIQRLCGLVGPRLFRDLAVIVCVKRTHAPRL